MTVSLRAMVDEIDLTVSGREDRIAICDELASKRRYSREQVDRMESRLPILIAIQGTLKFIAKREESFRKWVEQEKAKS